VTLPFVTRLRSWLWRRRVRIVAGVLILVLAGAGYAVLLRRAAANKRHDDAVAAAALADRRVAFAAQQLAGCEENNRQNEAIDDGYQSVFAPAFATSSDPARLSRILDGLRAGLTVSDCETVLAKLTRDEAARAREAAAAIPRSPLPPPTIAGYVPPGH